MANEENQNPEAGQDEEVEGPIEEQTQEGGSQEIQGVTDINQAIDVLIQAANIGKDAGVYEWDDLMKIYSAIQFFQEASKQNQEQGSGPQGPAG